MNKIQVNMRMTQRQISLCLVLCTVMLFTMLSGCGGGGPHSSPENVAKAWLKAVAAGDCGKAASYYAPNHRNRIQNDCGPECYISDYQREDR
jgi:hypothetical protein